MDEAIKIVKQKLEMYRKIQYRLRKDLSIELLKTDYQTSSYLSSLMTQDILNDGKILALEVLLMDLYHKEENNG